MNVRRQADQKYKTNGVSLLPEKSAYARVLCVFIPVPLCDHQSYSLVFMIFLIYFLSNLN